VHRALSRLARGYAIPRLSRGVAEIVTADASRLAELAQLANRLPNGITVTGVLVGLAETTALPTT